MSPETLLSSPNPRSENPASPHQVGSLHPVSQKQQPRPEHAEGPAQDRTARSRPQPPAQRRPHCGRCSRYGQRGGQAVGSWGPPFLLKVRAGCTKEDIRLLLALGIPGFLLARGGGRGRLLSAPRPPRGHQGRLARLSLNIVPSYVT